MMGKKGALRIAITGPESSGKSDLSEWLHARHPGSSLVSEYARIYLENRLPETQYDLADVLKIGEQQHALIQAADGKLNFFDTDYLVLHVWLTEVFGVSNSVYGQLFLTERFDLYLLCAPDLDWVYDPLRVNERDRDRLFKEYQSALIAAGFPYKIISGKGMERWRKAEAALNELIAETNSDGK
jgi:nicotinamide riboside kinase